MVACIFIKVGVVVVVNFASSIGAGKVEGVSVPICAYLFVRCTIHLVEGVSVPICAYLFIRCTIHLESHSNAFSKDIWIQNH